MKDFQSYHPLILFVYFVATLVITMLTMNPILVCISFLSSIIFCGMLIGGKKLLLSLCYSVPIMIIVALTNALFVHKGETILFFLNDNPITLESIIYGGFASAMLISIFYWCKCYNEIITSDKIIYLFGKITPKMALLLSMTLAFIPKFIRQFKEIDNAQKALGIYSHTGYMDKLKSKMRVLSILISWSLENSVQTADSMRARGYGLKGKTNFSLYKWKLKDTIFSIYVGILFSMVCCILFMGKASYLYYPKFGLPDKSIYAIIIYLSSFLLMISSTILEIKENILWQLLKSRI